MTIPVILDRKRRQMLQSLNTTSKMHCVNHRAQRNKGERSIGMQENRMLIVRHAMGVHSIFLFDQKLTSKNSFCKSFFEIQPACFLNCS